MSLVSIGVTEIGRLEGSLWWERFVKEVGSIKESELSWRHSGDSTESDTL